MTKSVKTLAITSAIAVAVSTLAILPAHAASKEKCYGVAKAGKNSCGGGKLTCTGTSKVDYQGNAWVLLKRGKCEKIKLPDQADGMRRIGSLEPLKRDPT